jgi:hypothetical protein
MVAPLVRGGYFRAAYSGSQLPARGQGQAQEERFTEDIVTGVDIVLFQGYDLGLPR